MQMHKRMFAVAAVFFLVLATAHAQEPASPVKIDWHRGPYKAVFGDATLEVPKNFAFADGSDARRFMELNHNPTSGNEVGLLVPTNLRNDQEEWFVLFEYNQVGYVWEKQQSDLPSDKILENIKTATENSNETRKQRG